MTFFVPAIHNINCIPVDSTPSQDGPERLTFGQFRKHPYEQPENHSVSVRTPTLTAANALQLHIDPTDDVPDTSPSSTNSHLEPNRDINPPSSTRQNRVRFRSRVRITSGLHGHRHNKTSSSQNGTENTVTTLSADSSLTSSPSSSISAPLRSRADDESNKPGWGPLGQRVNLFVFKNKKRHAGSGTSERDTIQREERRERRRRKLGLCPEPGSGFRVLNEPDERTPLMAAKRSDAVTALALEGGDGESVEESELCESDDDDEYEARLNREIDLIFGKWPGRLLNRYVRIIVAILGILLDVEPIYPRLFPFQWWWWQLEPIVCCRCVDDSDLDDDNDE